MIAQSAIFNFDPGNVIEDNFSIKRTVTRLCQGCHCESFTDEPTEYILTNVRMDHQNAGVDTLIYSTFENQVLKDCTACAQKMTCHTEVSTFRELPKILVVQGERYVRNIFGEIKKNRNEVQLSDVLWLSTNKRYNLF